MNAVVRMEDVINHRPAPVSFDNQLRMAQAFANSGFFGIKTADQALALMALCEAEGLHPAIAVRDYHIISGKPALKAEAMLARFQSAGGRVKWLCMTDDKVEGEFSHPAGGTVTIDWDKARVAKAQLAGNAMHTKYPRQMLRARVISEGIRSVLPGAVAGVYTPEEMEDELPPHQPERPAATQPSARNDYPADKFAENLPAWIDLISSGKKTHANVIAMLESKFALSDAQKADINAIEVAP